MIVRHTRVFYLKMNSCLKNNMQCIRLSEDCLKTFSLVYNLLRAD